MIYIVFGKCGAGKTYMSAVLAEHLGCLHIEVDDWLTDEMKLLINNKQPITQEAVDRYIQVVITKLLEIVKQNPKQDMVVSQALFMVKNRLELREALVDNCQFIQAVASDDNIIRRIRSSDANRLVLDPNYVFEMNKEFQSPGAKEKNIILIENNIDGRDNIIKQWLLHNSL